jgi:alpha-tubulin suppressor-like RCC1 family protein
MVRLHDPLLSLRRYDGAREDAMLRCLISIVVGSLILATIVLRPPVTTAAQRATPVPASGLDGVVAIASGGCHGLALRADGTVWGWDCDSDWELGAAPPGGGMITATPIQATGLDRVQGIATGSDHGLAVRSDGTVWAWGKNDHGQVGVPQGENCPHHPRPCVQVPVAVPGLRGVKMVAASGDSSFALDADGSVWAWGANESGQLGTGTTTDLPSPTRVDALTDITSLSVTGTSGVAVQADGTVWDWGGSAERASPRRVADLDRVIAVAAGDLLPNVALQADGSVWTWGDPQSPAPQAMEGIGPMTAIAVGAQLAGAVAADGAVWVWAFTFSGSTPEPPNQVDDLNDVVALAMGGESNLALKADGTVWEWNQYGHPMQVPAPDA